MFWLIFFFLLAMLVFAWRAPNWNRVVAPLLLFIVYVLGTKPLPLALLNGLQKYPPLKVSVWAEHNVIVVLGAGLDVGPERQILHTRTFGFARLVEAARQYHACHEQKSDCKILLSGGDPGHYSVNEADWMGRDLQEIGIPVEDLIFERESKNTFQNAQFSSHLIVPHKDQQIILVTSSFHMRRALLDFDHFKVPVQPAPADQWNPLPSIWPAAYNFGMVDLALHEYLGIAQFYFYEFMGWNANKI